MKKTAVIIAMLIMFIVPVFCAQAKQGDQGARAKWHEYMMKQRDADKAFRKTLEGMTKEQKKEAIMKYRDKQRKDRMEARDTILGDRSKDGTKVKPNKPGK